MIAVDESSPIDNTTEQTRKEAGGVPLRELLPTQKIFCQQNNIYIIISIWTIAEAGEIYFE